MPSIIYFTGSSGDGPLYARVSEEVSEVLDEFNASGGAPIELTWNTGRLQGTTVVVNPANIAYWREAPEK